MKRTMFTVMLAALLVYTTAAFAQSLINVRFMPGPVSCEFILVGCGVLSFLYPRKKA